MSESVPPPKAKRRFSFPLFTYVWRFKLTPHGKLLVGAGIVSGLLGSASLDAPVYPILCCLFFLGFTALLVNSSYRPRLRVHAELPDKAVAGQALEFEATVTNVGRQTAYDIAAGFSGLPAHLRDESPATYAPALAPGESIHIPLRILPRRRGVYVLPPLRAFTTFPFNILRHGAAKHPAGALIVQPAFTPLAEVHVPVSRRYQPGGIALTSNVGESPEYIGNREFRPGDPLKHIDFRSWARLAKPAVREYQEEYYCRLALIVDTFVPPFPFFYLEDNRSRKLGSRISPSLISEIIDFEEGISLSAAVADALSRGEYLVDIFAAGPEVHVFRAGRHTAHLENILEILACVDPCRKNPFPAVTARISSELRGISAVVAIFLDWDEDRRQLLRTAQDAGCHVKALIVRNRDTSVPITETEVADLQQFRRGAVYSGGIEDV